MPRQAYRATLTPQQKDFIFHKANGRCYYCGMSIESEWRLYPSYTHWGENGLCGFYITGGVIHHQIPLWQGGLDKVENKTLVCYKCHKQYHRQYPFNLESYYNGKTTKKNS